MSEQTKTLSKTEAIAKSPVQWAIGLVKNFAEKNPGIMESEQAQRCAMSAVSKTIGYLQENRLKWSDVDVNHLQRIYIRLAVAGLDAEAGDWYAYARQNKNTGLYQFEPNPSYQGERKLRIKYSIGSFGKIQDIQALTIREGDKLNIKRDLFGKCIDVQYDPLPFNKGAVIGYLGIVLFQDGTTMVKEYTPEKIEEYHKANPNKSPAWEKWYEEMAHAKVIKHTAKDFQYDLPVSQKKILAQLDAEDAEEEATEFEATKVIDITPEQEEPQPEKAEPVKQEETRKKDAVDDIEDLFK